MIYNSKNRFRFVYVTRFLTQFAHFQPSTALPPTLRQLMRQNSEVDAIPDAICLSLKFIIY